MIKTKAPGVIDSCSSTNIKEHPSIVGRANGTTALASAKVVCSFLGKWTFIKKLKTQIGVTYLMSFKVNDKETEFPIIASLMENDSHPQLSFDSMESLLLAEENTTPYKSISDYYEAYRNDAANPSAIIGKIIEFYKSEEAKTINFIYEFHEEEMRKAAEESGKRLKEGNARSLLEGVPFVVKEELSIKGYKSVKGLGVSDAKAEDKTYPAVQRLLDAGAILVGTTKMTQLGFGTIGCNPATDYGTVKNPCNPKFYIGGSSSGTAAAVSLGIVPFGISVDGLGSGRMPAALSGIVGLKSTFARVANAGKQTDISYTVVCPMTNNVRDAAILYGFMSGVHKDFEHGLNQPAVELPDFKTDFDLKSVRFGHDDAFTKASYNETIITAVTGVVDELKKAGYTVVDHCLPEMQENIAAMSATIIRRNQKLSVEFFGDKVEGMINCVNAKVLFALGSCIDDSEIQQACCQRTRAIQIVKEMFEKFEILVTPSAGTLAPKIETGDDKHGVLDDITSYRLIRYSALGSLTGIPSIVVNIGTNSENLPISLQLSAAWWNEKLLLDVAYQLEKMYSKEKRDPEIFKLSL